ncbi:hypothetical protein BGX28_003705 [Mortierella sp. GBA30]|nr:hypothetical protein BGX28_003705 [Mortierella sp. GBA30]
MSTVYRLQSLVDHMFFGQHKVALVEDTDLSGDTSMEFMACGDFNVYRPSLISEYVEKDALIYAALRRAIHGHHTLQETAPGVKLEGCGDVQEGQTSQSRSASARKESSALAYSPYGYCVLDIIRYGPHGFQ